MITILMKKKYTDAKTSMDGKYTNYKYTNERYTHENCTNELYGLKLYE